MIQLLVADQVVSCPCMLPYWSRTALVSLQLLTENILPWDSLWSPNTLIEPECFNWAHYLNCTREEESFGSEIGWEETQLSSCKVCLMVPKYTALGTWSLVMTLSFCHLGSLFICMVCASAVWVLSLWGKERSPTFLEIISLSNAGGRLSEFGEPLSSQLLTPTINAVH